MTQKKNKKLVAIIIAAVLLAALVAAAFIIRSHRLTALKNSFLSQDLELYDDFKIVAPSANVDNNRYSLSGFKEAVRLGANTVILDTCFTKDNLPVICESYDSINDDSLKFEDIAKLLTQEEYSSVSVCLNIKQLGKLTVLNSLISQYSLSERVIICGIDEDRYGLISGNDTFAKVYFDYKPADIAERSLDEINKLKAEYNIFGVVINYKNITDSLLKLLAENNIPYIISGIDKEADMYKALSMGISIIETAEPQLLNDIYKEWRNETLKRIDSSVINELSK